MNELRQYAKRMARSINDPLERKETENELYSNLLEAYEELRKSHPNKKEALQLTLENFGEIEEVGEELKQAHIKKINKKSLWAIVGFTMLIVIVLYSLLLIIFT